MQRRETSYKDNFELSPNWFKAKQNLRILVFHVSSDKGSLNAP